MPEIRAHNLTKPFQLEKGGVIEHPVVAYSTYGKLNSDKSNVVVVCHALTANSRVDDWWSGLFGEGNILDPDKYFIVCANNLGSPYGSSSPKSSAPNRSRFGHDFPFYTIRDKARFYLEFLNELGLVKNISMIIGRSCGGHIAQEMAIDLGTSLKHLVMLCCAKKEAPWTVAIHEAQRIALRSDPSFNDNTEQAGQDALKSARAIAMTYYRSNQSINKRQREETQDIIQGFKAASYVSYQGSKFMNRYDAQCYYHQLNSLDTHNLARERGSFEEAGEKILANSLVIGFSTDILIPPEEQKSLAEIIPNAKCEIIETIYGHDAFLIELDAIRKTIRKTLKR